VGGDGGDGLAPLALTPYETASDSNCNSFMTVGDRQFADQITKMQIDRARE
jgi:hypothetical protein